MERNQALIDQRTQGNWKTNIAIKGKAQNILYVAAESNNLVNIFKIF